MCVGRSPTAAAAAAAAAAAQVIEASGFWGKAYGFWSKASGPTPPTVGGAGRDLTRAFALRPVEGLDHGRLTRSKAHYL